MPIPVNRPYPEKVEKKAFQALYENDVLLSKNIADSGILVSIATGGAVWTSVTLTNENYTIPNGTGNIIIRHTTGASNFTVTAPTLSNFAGDFIVHIKEDTGAGEARITGSENFMGDSTFKTDIQGGIVWVKGTNQWETSTRELWRLNPDWTISVDKDSETVDIYTLVSQRDSWTDIAGLSVTVTPGTWEPVGKGTFQLTANATAFLNASFGFHNVAGNVAPDSRTRIWKNTTPNTSGGAINFYETIPIGVQKGDEVVVSSSETWYFKAYGDFTVGASTVQFRLLDSLGTTTFMEFRRLL